MSAMSATPPKRWTRMSKPEEDALCRLAASWSNLGEAKVEVLREVFVELHRIGGEVAAVSPLDLYEAQWAILGIVGRSYQLMICGVEQIASGNWNGFYAAARALLETLFSICWVAEEPKRLSSLVRFQQVKIGRMAAAGYRRHPEMRRLYDDLSKIVHPGRDSHLLSPNVTGDISREGLFTPFELSFSDYFAEYKAKVLIAVGRKIVAELGCLLAFGEGALRSGRIMAKVSPLGAS
jgi:hypothetical protein